MVASISAVTSFVSAPIRPLVGLAAPPATAGNVQTAGQNTGPKAVNFGPATQVQLSPQAQSLIAAGTNTAANSNTNTATNASTAASASSTSPAVLALSYQITAQQVWAQVLGSLGLTQQQLNALPVSQRSTTEAKAVLLAESLVAQQVNVPSGVSASEVTSSIAAAVSAIA